MYKYLFNKSIKLTLAVASAFLIMSCNQNKETVSDKELSNVLLQEWTGPYGGVPAFDKMNINDIKSALEKGMELNLEEIDAITGNPETATFDNTIVELEKAGETLSRIRRYYGLWSSNISTPEFRKIQGEMAPILSEFNSKISQNTELFKRIKVVYDNSLKNPLEDDQQRVVQLIYVDLQ